MVQVTVWRVEAVAVASLLGMSALRRGSDRGFEICHSRLAFETHALCTNMAQALRVAGFRTDAQDNAIDAQEAICGSGDNSSC